MSLCSRARDQQHRAEQQLDQHHGFGWRSWTATPAAADRPQGRRSILPRGQHSSSSRSSSTGHGSADPAPRAPSSCLSRASASASDSQWTAVLFAAQDLDRPKEEEQYVLYNAPRHLLRSPRYGLLFYLRCSSRIIISASDFHRTRSIDINTRTTRQVKMIRFDCLLSRLSA